MTADQDWVLLSYRVPREPSTPRIAIWRRLKDIGVVQIGDGLVGLPRDARTQEQLEWVRSQVLEAGGEAIVWRATPTTADQHDRLAAQLDADRRAELTELAHEVGQMPDAGGRTIARWRRDLRRIDRRGRVGRLDEIDEVRRAIDASARHTDAPHLDADVSEAST